MGMIPRKPRTKPVPPSEARDRMYRERSEARQAARYRKLAKSYQQPDYMRGAKKRLPKTYYIDSFSVEGRGGNTGKTTKVPRSELPTYLNKVTPLEFGDRGGVMTLDAFDEAIQMFGKRVEQWGSQVYRAYCSDIYTGIVARTPMKSGKARNNWMVGLNGIPSGTRPPLPDMARDELMKIQKARLLEDNVYITNNLPYISNLEGGDSNQAPRGMVSVTVAEVNAYYSADMTEKIALGRNSPLYGNGSSRGRASNLMEEMENQLRFEKEIFGDRDFTRAPRQYGKAYGNVASQGYAVKRKATSKRTGEELHPTRKEGIGKQRAGKKGKVRQSHQKYDHYTLEDLLIDSTTGRRIPSAPAGPKER